MLGSTGLPSYRNFSYSKVSWAEQQPGTGQHHILLPLCLEPCLAGLNQEKSQLESLDGCQEQIATPWLPPNASSAAWGMSHHSWQAWCSGDEDYLHAQTKGSSQPETAPSGPAAAHGPYRWHPSMLYRNRGSSTTTVATNVLLCACRTRERKSW